MNRKLLARIEELFKLMLQGKTNWGRNDVMAVYKECVNQAVLELLEEK